MRVEEKSQHSVNWIKSGDTVYVSFDKDTDKVAFNKVETEAKPKKPRAAGKKSAAKSAEGKKESAGSET